MRPQKSNSQEASNGSEYSVNVEEVGELDTDDCRNLVTEGLALTVGKYCDRACFTMARAARKLASAAATVWLETTTWPSNAFNSGSWNISHHWPRITSSFGSAVFQPPISFDCSGVNSLKAAGVWTDGFAYFGAKLHPANKARHASAIMVFIEWLIAIP